MTVSLCSSSHGSEAKKATGTMRIGAQRAVLANFEGGFLVMMIFL
jgi:hypothetical protein